MPESKEHYYHAEHNLEFLKSFCPSHKYNDWAITVAFYTSVHLVEYAIGKRKRITYRGHALEGIEHSDQLPAYASKCGIGKPSGLKLDSKSQHYLRNVLIEGSDEFSKVSPYYISLYKKSRQSRYYKYSWNDTEINLVMKMIFIPLLNWFAENFHSKLTYEHS